MTWDERATFEAALWALQPGDSVTVHANGRDEVWTVTGREGGNIQLGRPARESQ